MEYATYEAREATFAPPSKRSKAGGWPHAAPKAADLAKAGFYYKPSAHSNDNAVCFLCSRNLDGWEEDDDPIQEHLKHAEDCGWAILASIDTETEFDPSSMEDPTDQRLTAARRATFVIGWPHETKRGWTCKVEKMVEAGWHFSPTSDSEDYVSCAYCKLSLDGWEPKDNPFEEHHSRSPSCPFFVFAGATAPSKRSKAKKGRASRTSRASSRVSTQSNTGLHTEAPTNLDIDESLDTSAVSLMSTASTATNATAKGKRKTGASRAKAPKTKKAKTTKSKEAAKEDLVHFEAEDVSEKQHTPEEQVIYPTIEVPPGPGTVSIGINEDVAKAFTPQSVRLASSLGPPDREASVIPVAVDSPIPARLSSTQQSTSNQLPHGSHEQPYLQPISQAKSKTKKTTTTKAKSTAKSRQQTAAPQQANVQMVAVPEKMSSSPSTPRSKAGDSTSDIENAPPSTLPKSSRPPPPPPLQSQSQSQAYAQQTTSTSLSPIVAHTQSQSRSQTMPTTANHMTWEPVDIDLIFDTSLSAPLFSKDLTSGNLTVEERQMTVQDWIKHIASQAEEDLRMEGEKAVSLFEREGQRAMGMLESIVCT